MSIQFKFEEKKHVEQTIVQTINNTQFYNLMQDISMAKLIVDVRDRESYDLSHAKAAIHLPISDREIMSQMTSVDCLTTLSVLVKNSQFKMRGLLYKTLVLYNETSEREEDLACHILAKWLAQERKVDYVYILDKYTTFASKYPFLCTTKDGGVAYHLSYPSEITENFLYLGDRVHASTRKILDDLDIRYVLNMAEELANTFEEDDDFYYCKLGVGDTLNDNIRPTFETAVKFIQNARENDGRVLVHCNMGVSRSTTALISYLMVRDCVDFDTAFSDVKQKRPIVHPNETFKQQLNSFYSERHQLHLE